MIRNLLTVFLLSCAASQAFAQANPTEQQADPGIAPTADDALVDRGRLLIAREHPDVIRHSFRNNGFGGPSSNAIATAMLSDAPALVAEARAKMTVEPHGRGMWLLRFPYVNVAVIETRRGVVVFDTGYAAIGPVLVDTIPTLTTKPVTHIIVSHIHNDHA